MYKSKLLLTSYNVLFRPVSSAYILDYSGLLVDHYPLKGAQFLYGTGLAVRTLKNSYKKYFCMFNISFWIIISLQRLLHMFFETINRNIS